MYCYKCGCELDPFNSTCPKCSRRESLSSTRRLKTQRLVQLDQCSRCNMLLFPADVICPSCGAPVRRPDPRSKNAALRGRPPAIPWRRVVVGAALSAVGITVTALLFRLLNS